MDDMTYAEWLETATETTVAEMPAAKDFPETFVQDGVLYERVNVVCDDAAFYRTEDGRCVQVYA